MNHKGVRGIFPGNRPDPNAPIIFDDMQMYSEQITKQIPLYFHEKSWGKSPLDNIEQDLTALMNLRTNRFFNPDYIKVSPYPKNFLPKDALPVTYIDKADGKDETGVVEGFWKDGIFTVTKAVVAND